MQELDIVSLIEKNPISKLSSTYNNKLLTKIKANFTDFEQQLFVSSFYSYLNYDKNIDFVIDLDDIWKWIGFNQKIKAVSLLEKNFNSNIDYKILAFPEWKASCSNEKWGGQNIKKIFLTIKCFKLLCLKAQTKKASEIHEYYIKMEELLQQTIEEETDELRKQLQQKENIIIDIKNNKEKEKQTAVEQAIVLQFPLNTECIYIGTIENTNENGEKLIKFGHTNDLSTRINDHRKNYMNFILVTAFRVQNKVEIEKLIKTHPKIKKQIRNIQVNGKNKTEIIAYDNNFTIDELTKCIKDIIHSKTYSIDNFNKLLKQNEELNNENIQLQEQIKNNSTIITNLNIKINELNDIVTKQKDTLEKYYQENQSVYNNVLLPEDELTEKFNKFIEEMCIVRQDVEESSTNMEGQYRIWSKIKPKKEVFHAFKNYLDVRFKPSRLTNQNKNQIVHGYIGVKLKNIEYKKKLYNEVETFIFQVCSFSPSGKILNYILLDEYKRWKHSLNKDINGNEMKELKDYLNDCEYALKSTVWTDCGSNEGYYGLSLKNSEYNHKVTSSTGKKVEKIELITGNVIGTWETIAKAASFENMSAAKMSRSIKKKIIFNNDYYYKII
jgi:hypothetical protein